MLLISNTLYSSPSRNSGKDMKLLQYAFMNGLLDILDIAELTFEDFGCFQTYEQGWLVSFDIILLVSIFLTSFINGIEKPKKKVVTLKLIFNDLSLLLLRSVKISKQGHRYGSIIFITKEVFSIISRLTLLCYFSDDDDNARYNQLDDVEAN